MGKAAQIEILGKIFNKKSLTDYVRKILHKYDVGQPINLSDFEFIRNLLNNHPSAKEKIGSGVDKILVVEQQKVGLNRHFLIVRIDGSETDFSYLACITQPNPYVKFCSVCRRVVGDQIINFKRTFFNQNKSTTCPITGQAIKAVNSHVDHISPNTFDVLIQGFIAKYSINVKDVEYIQIDNQVGACFKNDQIRDDFYRYHEENAKMRVVSIEANLSILKR